MPALKVFATAISGIAQFHQGLALSETYDRNPTMTLTP
jgi:hypothetical protein